MSEDLAFWVAIAFFVTMFPITFALPGSLAPLGFMICFLPGVTFLCLYLDKWMKKHLKAIPVRVVKEKDQKEDA